MYIFAPERADIFYSSSYMHSFLIIFYFSLLHSFLFLWKASQCIFINAAVGGSFAFRVFLSVLCRFRFLCQPVACPFWRASHDHDSLGQSSPLGLHKMLSSGQIF
jgi:hypothetical protein